MSTNTASHISGDVPHIYSASKGADWFDMIYRRDIIIIGQGGIGSWLSFLLSRTGANLHIYDYDKFEGHNGGQVMFAEDDNVLKTEAMKNTIASFSPDCQVTTYNKYTRSSQSGRIVLCGPDNIPTRQLAFEKWNALVNKAPASEKSTYFFQDGRLFAEQMQIFSITGNKPEHIERYHKEFLQEPDEKDNPSCTFRQTTPMAAGIAFKMIGYLTNWLTNVKRGRDICRFPFVYEYLLAPDVTITIYD
jgi:hypothetical protein